MRQRNAIDVLRCIAIFCKSPSEQLLLDVWGYQHAGYARTVDSHVTRVRRKLKEAGLDEPVLETVHAVGYAFAPSRIAEDR